jgi:hypothetical protein
MNARHGLAVVLVLVFLATARSEEEKPDPYDGWSKEQFAADREKKQRELRARATAYLDVRLDMLAVCGRCGGTGTVKLPVGKKNLPMPCTGCTGSGGKVHSAFDPDRLWRFHFGHDRPEAMLGRETLRLGLLGSRFLALLLPLKSAEIREVRIDGEYGIVLTAARRGNMPMPPDPSESPDVSRWIRVDGKWWHLDPLLMLQMKGLVVPKLPRYPEAERARPRHAPEAVALIEKARGLLAPIPIDAGTPFSFLVKVRPRDAKRDAKYRVAWNAERTSVEVETEFFPKSSAGGYAARERWDGRVLAVMRLLLETPVIPDAADFHLKLLDGPDQMVEGDGFSSSWFLRSFVARFGEDGLPTAVEWTHPSRSLSVLPVFKSREDGAYLAALEVRIGKGREEFEVRWKRTKDLWLPSKITHTIGKSEFTYRMSLFKVTPAGK